MTHLSNRQSQTGAVLVVALVMLLVLTLMAVGSMRGTTLESRITANRAHDTQQQSAADAALREAEFRYYGPANLIDKLEGKAANCKLTNTLNVNGLNKPCLLAINDADLLNFVDNPWLTKESFLKSESAESLLWMPYRGTDANNQTVAGNRETSNGRTTYWNSTRAVTVGNNAVNAEYGMVAEGQGTYYYLNNAKADEQVYLQSTHANIYLGLNN
ncbi:PilX N-terminal domain-containing pilus assembly protein [Pseudomonas sp. URMO17WK12:I2]|uniref:PilX N-terminal domain-containing pilus assembly protein n=1 Tax=Pseudomonas sp. URMO17WK12:I2 TaxID=1261623 RepID=UPI000DAE19AC|nr:PilX N-terminal domain-containing pilus assembly protein [Pseudomonas sp. URMO17WK12:I2]PZW49801.1 type IV pilus assembly protein PilX [Pseudomonas sp. URMO17WK12:I2]